MRRLTRVYIILFWKPILVCLLASCSAPKVIGGNAVAGGIAVVSQAPTSSTMLPWVGGLATIGGIVALVLTRGGMGIRAIIVGIMLVLLNDLMQRFATAFYLPILIGTAGVSLAYAYKTIRHALNKRGGKWASGK